jgi:hypothetical protein
MIRRSCRVHANSARAVAVRGLTFANIGQYRLINDTPDTSNGRPSTHAFGQPCPASVAKMDGFHVSCGGRYGCPAARRRPPGPACRLGGSPRTRRKNSCILLKATICSLLPVPERCRGEKTGCRPRIRRGSAASTITRLGQRERRLIREGSPTAPGASIRTARQAKAADGVIESLPSLRK